MEDEKMPVKGFADPKGNQFGLRPVPTVTPIYKHKVKAAEIYDQYWSQVTKLPVKDTDPLPDIRPLIEAALVEADSAARGEERAWIGRQLGALREYADPAEENVLKALENMLVYRADQCAGKVREQLKK